MVCGLCDTATTQFLLLQKNPDLATVIQMATSREAAAKDSTLIRAGKVEDSHHVWKSRQ